MWQGSSGRVDGQSCSRGRPNQLEQESLRDKERCSKAARHKGQPAESPDVLVELCRRQSSLQERNARAARSSEAEAAEAQKAAEAAKAAKVP